MKLKFKSLHELAFLPHYSKPGDAALDLYAIDNGTMNRESDYMEYRTGLSAEIPEGFVGLIFPRSSISNYSLMLSNAVGVLDSGYRSEIKVRFKYTGFGDKLYKQGDRVAQLIVLPYPTVDPVWCDRLTETARGSGGFGSTGE